MTLKLGLTRYGILNTLYTSAAIIQVIHLTSNHNGNSDNAGVAHPHNSDFAHIAGTYEHPLS
jgi:hypothetical protein